MFDGDMTFTDDGLTGSGPFVGIDIDEFIFRKRVFPRQYHDDLISALGLAKLAAIFDPTVNKPGSVAHRELRYSALGRMTSETNARAT